MCVIQKTPCGIGLNGKIACPELLWRFPSHVTAKFETIFPRSVGLVLVGENQAAGNFWSVFYTTLVQTDHFVTSYDTCRGSYPGSEEAFAMTIKLSIIKFALTHFFRILKIAMVDNENWQSDCSYLLYFPMDFVWNYLDIYLKQIKSQMPV